jgi:4'-phosphopantetheinyl transferase
MDLPQAAANERMPPIPTVYLYEVDLASAPTELGELLKLLDDRELAQAQRFATPELKRKYVVSHGSVRLALGRYLDVLPSDVRFVEAPHGKPQLDPCHASEVQFNLSHSGEKCLIAISAGSPVGVDVERLRPLEDWREIAQRFFSEREYQRLLALPVGLVNVAFFATWSRKEAYIKALGLGLALDLSAFEVEVDPRTEARLVWTRDAAEGPTRWAMRDISVGPHYRAALAVRGQHCNVVRMEADFDFGGSI